MKLGNVTTIFRKELVETLRDRRTLIFMLLVPVLAIPGIMLGMSKLMISQIGKLEKETTTYVVQGWDYLPHDLQDKLNGVEKLERKSEADFNNENVVDKVKDGALDAVLAIREDFLDALNAEDVTKAEIYYDKAEDKSAIAKDRLKEVLDEYSKSIVAQRMTVRGLSGDLLKPFEISVENVAPMQKVIGKGFGTFLPYIIIIMCFLGAMYPAIDLAAGEKERGTLETLLVSPASRIEFVIGKYLVIMLTGMVAGLLSLGSLVYSLRFILQGEIEELAGKLEFSLDIQTILLVILVIIPLVGIFAGILLSVSIFARSYKEAQSYISGLNMVIILPAVVSFLPGVELNYQLSLIPVVNASLIMKEAITGLIQWQYVLTAFAANFILAFVALFFCKKRFEQESVLFRT